MSLLERKNTGWRVLNAVTYYTQNLGGNSLKRHQNNLYGVGKTMRRHTYDKLNDLLPSSAIPVGL